jgi:hypothetical protein
MSKVNSCFYLIVHVHLSKFVNMAKKNTPNNPRPTPARPELGTKGIEIP